MSQGIRTPGALLAATVALLLAAAGGAAQSGGSEPPSTSPRLSYTKILKGSTPEFLKVSVEESGVGTYEGRGLADPPSPRPLQLSKATTERLFALAAQLNDFQGIELESHRKVANLGQKTFAYKAEGHESRVEFNYTLNRDAQDLADLFEKIGIVEQHLTTLEFAMRYDHLSLPRELLQIQIDLENRALADPELLVPTLEKITQNPRFLHLAQARAEDILKRLHSTN